MRSLLLVGLFVVIAACGEADDAHVGSRDCALIVASTDDPATAQVCSSCQGASCDTAGCDNLPCVDDVVILQGCASDDDCAEFPDAPLCGAYTAPDNLCVRNDAV